MDEIIIRPLLPSEWKLYKQIRLEALKSDSQAFGDSYKKSLQYSDEKWQERPNNPNGTILIAQKDKRQIGMVGIYKKPQENRAEIWGMYINSDFRGQGLGKLLLKKALNILSQEEDIHIIKLTVNPHQTSAYNLYLSCGFRESGLETLALGDGETYNVIIMEKNNN